MLKIPIRAALCCVLVAAFAVGVATIREGNAREPLVRITPLVSSGTSIVGETVRYPQEAAARITAAIVALAPGEETGWHRHGVPTFGYILEGELTVDYGEKGRHVYRPGDAFLEAIEVAHNGRNTGAGIMRVLVVFATADGLATSAPATAPSK